VPAPQWRRGIAAAGALVRGLPGQAGWMFPGPAWQVAKELAASSDVALVVTLRSVRGRLPCPVVIDHVDSLALNMRRRSRGHEAAPIRLAAGLEAALLDRLARRATDWCAAQVVTTRADAESLPSPPRVEVIPVAFDGELFEEPAGHVRDIDVILTGNMRYPPNKAAATTLDRQIVPAIQSSVANVRAVVAGRGADSLRLANCEVRSDVPDLLAVLQRARILVAPLKGGTGSPYKLLEAAASGVAIVAPRWAAQAFDMPCATAEEPQEFASRALELLRDEGKRRALVARARDVLERHRGSARAAELERVLLAARSS